MISPPKANTNGITQRDTNKEDDCDRLKKRKMVERGGPGLHDGTVHGER